MEPLMEMLRARFDTQAMSDFAHEIGLHPSSISRWMQGQTPSLEGLLRCSIGLAMDPTAVIASSAIPEHVEIWDRLMRLAHPEGHAGKSNVLHNRIERIIAANDPSALALVEHTIRYVEHNIRRRKRAKVAQ